MRKRLMVILTVWMLAAAACRATETVGELPPAEAPPPPQNAPATLPPAVPPPTEQPRRPTPAERLFPAEDRRVSFRIHAVDRDRPDTLTVAYRRDGNQIHELHDGEPHATWLFDNQGAWRMEPGPNQDSTRLLYLPTGLAEGRAWRQGEGDAAVWFRLDSGRATCAQRLKHMTDTENCWNLTVLHGDEKRVSTFVEGYGPLLVEAEHWGRLEASFRGYPQQPNPPWPRPTAPTDAGEAPPRTLPDLPAAVTPVTVEAFAAEAQRRFNRAMQGPSVIRLDLEGDGSEELIRGPLDTWTSAPFAFYRADGTRFSILARSSWVADEHRLRMICCGIFDRSLFIHQSRAEDRAPEVHLYWPGPSRQTEDAGPWSLQMAWWEPKSDRTQGQRVTVADDGVITIAWDLGDPARHTRIRQYHLRTDGQVPYMDLIDSAYVPEGETLVYPDTPGGVLEAAFIAAWYGLDGEYNRYFASPEAAAVLAGDERISEPPYAPGQVYLGEVILSRQPGQWPPVKSVPIGPDGSTGFFANWTVGWEQGQQLWGRVTFGADAEGRPVIEQIHIDGGRKTGV